MPYEAWSYILTGVGALGMYIVGKKSWVGWLIMLSGQGLWAWYSIQTHQTGFLLSVLIYGSIQAKNLYAWTIGGHGPV